MVCSQFWSNHSLNHPGNNGLGKETIHQLSKHRPSKIFLAARSKERADEAIYDVKRSVPNARIEFVQLDLNSFDSIKKAASTINSSTDRLDILFNNAGIMAVPPSLTKEGYEVQFGVNHMGHALLTKLLLPKLKQTATKPNADVRIINLSSARHGDAPKEGYLWKEIKTPMAKAEPFARYGQSKLANIHFNRQLARENPDIKCISLHPGVVSTGLINGPRASYPLLSFPLKLANKFFFTSVQEGAKNQLWAATSKQAKSGCFYFPIAVEGKDSDLARDDKLSKQLWDWTEKELAPHVTPY